MPLSAPCACSQRRRVYVVETMDLALPEVVALDGIAIDDDELFSARTEVVSKSVADASDKESAAPLKQPQPPQPQQQLHKKVHQQQQQKSPPTPSPPSGPIPEKRPQLPRWGLAVDEQEELAEIQTQVKAFLRQLPAGEQHQVVDRLLRRLAEGQPLSARRVSDRVDESCEFLAELLDFCSSRGLQEAALTSVASARGGAEANLEGSALGFLASRRQHRLTSVRKWLDWEEHFTNDGGRYFYNNATQKTQYHVPEGWPHDPNLPPVEESCAAADASTPRTHP